MPVEEPIREFIRRLYHDNYNRLIRYGCSIEQDEGIVHDEIQELFVWLLRHPDHIRKIKKPETYLLMSLRRNIRSTARRSRIARQHSRTYHDNQQKEESGRESRMIEEESEAGKKLWLKDKIAKLPARQKEAVYLRYFENLAYDDIAEIFGVGNQVVRNIIYRAIKNLRRKDLHLEGYWLLVVAVLYFIQGAFFSHLLFL